MWLRSTSRCVTGFPAAWGAFASSMGTMLLLLALALVARLSINLTMLAAFLAVLRYSFLDVGIYCEQMRGVLRKAGGDDALEAAQEAGKACRLQRVILVIIGVAMFLGALLLGSKALMSFSLCAAAGILISALCTALLGVPASFWAKKPLRRTRKCAKSKSNQVAFLFFLQRRSLTAFCVCGGFSCGMKKKRRRAGGRGFSGI